MKKMFFICSVLLFAAGSVCAGTLSISPGTAEPVVIGAAQCSVLPEKSPVFTLQLFEDAFEVILKTPLSPGEKIHNAGMKNDDESMFAGDVAEFFISPDPRRQIYYQIAANSAGLLYTARGRDTSWNPAIKYKVSRKKDFWSVTFTIPYREINTVKPDSRTVWKANFSVTLPAGHKKQSCSWSGARDFHNISEFGTIRFDSAPLPRLLAWDVKNDIFNAVLKIPAECKYDSVICELEDKKYQGKKDGELLTFQIPVYNSYVFPKRFCFAHISVYSGKEKIYSRTGKLEPAGRQTLELDGFYFPVSQKSTTYRQTFGNDAELRLKSGANHLIARYPADRSGKISIAGLKPGRYILELRAGALYTSRVFQIVPDDFTLPAIAGNARLEITDGIFHLDGQPVFLIGGSSTPRNHLPNANAFNMNTGNIGAIPNAVAFKGFGHTRFIRKPFSGSYLNKFADDIIKKRMAETPAGNREVRRLAYEAQIQLCDGNINSPRKLDAAKYYATLYRKLKAEYPERYFSIHIDRREVMADFLNSCDIFEFASWRSSYASNMMPFLVKDMQQLRQEAGKKPLIYWLGGSIPTSGCRMAEELRAAVYCAMIQNLNGVIFHLGHGGIAPEKKRLWSLIANINAEIQPVYREFAKGRELPGFVREIKGNFLWSARLCGKKVCFAAVNLNSSEQVLDMKTSAGNVKVRLTPFEPVYLTLAGN